MHKTGQIYVMLKCYTSTFYTTVLFVHFLFLSLINTELRMLFTVMNVLSLTSQIENIRWVPHFQWMASK